MQVQLMKVCQVDLRAEMWLELRVTGVELISLQRLLSMVDRVFIDEPEMSKLLLDLYNKIKDATGCPNNE
jgi:hypothetical protein